MLLLPMPHQLIAIQSGWTENHLQDLLIPHLRRKKRDNVAVRTFCAVTCCNSIGHLLYHTIQCLSVCMLCICLLLCVYLSLIVLCPVGQSDNLFLARIYTIFIAVSQFGLVLVAVLLPQPLYNPSPLLSHLKFSAQFRSRESLEVTLICGNHCVYTDTVNFY